MILSFSPRSHPLLQPQEAAIRQRGFSGSRSYRFAAFSLVEVMIGVVISALVLVVAVRMIMALVQSGVASELELNRKDDLSRVLDLMQNEILNARRVQSGSFTDSDRLSGCSTTPQLILRGTVANEDISYGLRSQDANTTWRGPAVLVRCGPLYNDNGTLAAGSPPRSEQVVLDTLCTPATPGCNSESGFSAATLSGPVSRSVEVSLNSIVSNRLLSRKVQVPINTNQVYSLTSSGFSSSCPSGHTGSSVATGCLDPSQESMHYRPTLGGANITASPGLDNVFYFDGNRSEYTLSSTPGSGLCTREQCTVQLGLSGASITFFSASVLVFRDVQIRL